MKEVALYQKAFATSIEQAINACLSVNEYLTRLARMKADEVFFRNIGRPFKNEKGEDVIVAAVGWRIKHDVYQTCTYNQVRNTEAIWIQVAFVKDPTSLLERGRQLTEAERQKLKRLKQYILDASYEKNTVGHWGSCSKKTVYDEIIDLGKDLEELKHRYKFVERGEWLFNLDEVLDDGFLGKRLEYYNKSL